jgi:hypothetical protein
LICRGRGIKKISGKNKEALIGMIEADKAATVATVATAATHAKGTLEAFGFGRLNVITS